MSAFGLVELYYVLSIIDVVTAGFFGPQFRAVTGITNNPNEDTMPKDSASNGTTPASDIFHESVEPILLVVAMFACVLLMAGVSNYALDEIPKALGLRVESSSDSTLSAEREDSERDQGSESEADEKNPRTPSAGPEARQTNRGILPAVPTMAEPGASQKLQGALPV